MGGSGSRGRTGRGECSGAGVLASTRSDPAPWKNRRTPAFQRSSHASPWRIALGHLVRYPEERWARRFLRAERTGPKKPGGATTWQEQNRKWLAEYGVGPDACLDRDRWRELTQARPTRRTRRAGAEHGTIQAQARQTGRRRSCVASSGWNSRIQSSGTWTKTGDFRAGVELAKIRLILTATREKTRKKTLE